MYAGFEAADTVVIAVSQEDTELELAGQILWAFGEAPPPFPMICDLERGKTLAYDRTTAYLIDKQGIVREIFPMIIHARPSWKVILDAARELSGKGERAPVEAGSGR